MFNNHDIAHFSETAAVKIFRKSINIWREDMYNDKGTFFETHCISGYIMRPALFPYFRSSLRSLVRLSVY